MGHGLSWAVTVTMGVCASKGQQTAQAELCLLSPTRRTATTHFTYDCPCPAGQGQFLPPQMAVVGKLRGESVQL